MLCITIYRVDVINYKNIQKSDDLSFCSMNLLIKTLFYSLSPKIG